MSKANPLNHRVVSISFLFISQLLLPMGSANIASLTPSQERRYAQTDLALEIILPNNPGWPHTLAITKGGRSMTLLRRQFFTINDPKLAGDFTAVDVWADGEDNAVRVRLSIIYNDISNQEWWKDKKEKVAGSLLIREGEAGRLAELAQFGIEPFEMRAISARPVLIQPGEAPRIVNNTKSLEVLRLEKSLDRYQIFLKNNSSKNVIGYTVSSGSGGFSSNSYGSVRPVIAAGATTDEIHFQGSDAEKGDITIPVVVFEDLSFEGDPLSAAWFLVNIEGIRIQAPHILPLIEQALQADDAGIQEAFDKLEGQLWGIPEAINKPSAIELLRSRYTSFDDKTISRLYEELKGGLYGARNRVLSPIGDIKRRIQDNEQRQKQSPEIRARLLRETLTRIKDDCERLIGTKSK